LKNSIKNGKDSLQKYNKPFFYNRIIVGLLSIGGAGWNRTTDVRDMNPTL
jgi:hypothetical protein